MLQKGKDKGVETQALPQEQDVLADIHDQLKLEPPVWWLFGTHADRQWDVEI